MSNPKEATPVFGACLGAPTKMGNALHGQVQAWVSEHPDCTPER